MIEVFLIAIPAAAIIIVAATKLCSHHETPSIYEVEILNDDGTLHKLLTIRAASNKEAEDKVQAILDKYPDKQFKLFKNN